MEQKLSQARILLGILVVLLIIAVAIIWYDTSTISALKKGNAQNITTTADTIRADCSSTDPATHAKCGDDLQQLSDLLAQFSKTLPAGSAGTPTK